MGFSKQEYWSGLPFPPPGDLPDPGIEPESPVFPTLQADSLPADVSRKKIFSLLFLSFMLKILIVKLFDIQFSSVQFSHSVMSDSLRPHELQHTRPPCPSPTPRVHSDSRPSSRWCHPAISSSVVPFSSCPQSLPALESFPWVNSSHEVSKVLEFQLKHHSFQRTPRTALL